MKRLAEPPTRRFSLRHRRADRAMKGANRPGTARSSRPVVAALVAAFVAAGAVLADTPAAERTAEETPPALSDTDEPGSRPFPDRLTGDWGGLRTALAERGVSVDLASTHYDQGLLSGAGDKSFEYGGRVDLLVDFDTSRLHLWRGGVIRTHTEYRYGDLRSALGGALLATNTGLILPTGEDEEWVLTSLHLAQRIGERSVLLLGRINALDLLETDPFFGGGGRSRFLHLAFASPPSGVTPAVLTGAILTVRGSPSSWTFMVYDPDDRTDEIWPDDLFGNGITGSVSVSRATKLAGRTTLVSVSGTYTTKDGADLGELLLPPDLRTGDRDHSWFAGVQIAHFLRERSDLPGAGWGLFLKLGTSDGNPNPFQGSVIAGVGGRGPFRARPDDRFGIGWFHVDFSDDLQSSLDPLVTFGDERGLEAFYDFAVMGWLRLSVDLQRVEPALGDGPSALVGGLRASVRF